MLILSIRVTILGSGSALPIPGRHPSSQLVAVESSAYLVDCGEGTQFRLRDLKISTSRIRAICISHLHGDHYYGLFGLLDSLSLIGRQEPLVLIGPENLRRLLIEVGRATQKSPTFDLKFVSTDPTAVGKVVYEDEHVSIESFAVAHGIDCTGFSFQTRQAQRNIRKEKLFDGFPIDAIRALKEGNDVFDEEGREVLFSVQEYTLPPAPVKRYAYCADTVFLPSLTTYLNGVDLLYHEATFAEELEEKAHLRGHSTTTQAARIALESAAKRLLIGHFSSRYEVVEPMVAEARTLFADTHYAEEGVTFTA